MKKILQLPFAGILTAARQLNFWEKAECSDQNTQAATQVAGRVRSRSLLAAVPVTDIMKTEGVTFSVSTTVSQTLERLAAKPATVVWVTDKNDKVAGFVSSSRLLRARFLDTLGLLVQKVNVALNINDNCGQALKLFRSSGLTSVPVLDTMGAFTGVIELNDLLPVLSGKPTVAKPFAKKTERVEYKKTTILGNVRARVGWIVTLSLFELVSGSIIHSFEGQLTNCMILAMYMPMLTDTGGNIGSQSATIVVRGLATGEITIRDFLKVIFKETSVAMVLAVILGFVSLGKVLFLSQNSVIPAGFSLIGIGTCIAVALSIQVVSSAVIGCLLPMIATRLKMDPAVSASPALTTIVDITGLLIYFTTAKLMLGL
ncbi:magnesium transporter [Lentisphaerota bacterium ZTH]|nr:magnesium transporter [Lentisphaerota bacterium]WET05487.1 magnesium transporter [Lentisphaerota bacterium ZTH]